MGKAETSLRYLEEKITELGEPCVNVISGRKLYMTDHRGIIELGTEHIEIGLKRGKISVRGTNLSLQAMNERELIITGRIGSVEWE